MKSNIFLFLLLAILSFSNVAVADVIAPRAVDRSNFERRNRPHREFSFEQYQEDKCNFIIQEMQLSSEESSRFLPVYKQLLEAKSALYRKYGGAHRIMRSVSEGQQVADSTMQRAVQNARQLQLEDAQLEQDYLAKFEKILTPVQVIRLQEAEQKFKNEMMKRGPRGRY